MPQTHAFSSPAVHAMSCVLRWGLESAHALLAGAQAPLISAEELDALVLDDLQYKYAGQSCCATCLPCIAF